MGVINAKDFEKISPFFRGKFGQWCAALAMRMLAFDKVNKVYDHSSNYTGAEFAARLLNDLGVNYVIGNADRLKQLPEGAFVTVSNHPYGGLDGIIMIDLMAKLRPDYKIMVNKILAMVKTMKENFIAVTPTGDRIRTITSASINGIRETLTSLQNGHPVGFCPSGAVSDFRLKDFRIRDRRWQESILHLIHSVKVPIIPIRFFDTNSALYYFLGLINWRIRLLRLPSELFNKGNRQHRIAIGNIISVEEQEKFADSISLGAFLRKAVYEMPMPASFLPKTIMSLPEIHPGIV
jgi:putative hemolysin